MIRIGDNYYRNLEEQVLKNKQDIAEHYNRDRVLADFGITIVGYAETPEELPNPETYSGSYGDGYYVGTNTPYNFYIYTRPNPDAGHYTNYWLDIGPLAVTGPEGPKGDIGPEGPIGVRGSTWTSVYDTLPQAINYNVNDQVLRTYDGNVYECKLDTDENKYWALIGNIQGPQGIQGILGIQGIQGPQGSRGPKGDTGDVGGFINIYGILTSSAQLPQPSTLNNLTIAYLIGSTTPYDLYVQVGSTSNTANWTNTGPFNAATVVSVNGVYLNIWNADTKLDKDTSVTTYNQVYVKSAAGGQGTINVTKQVVADAVPQRQSDGNIYVPATPVEATDASSKGYVDTQISSLSTQISTTYQPKLTAGSNITIDANNTIKATVPVYLHSVKISGLNGANGYTVYWNYYNNKSTAFTKSELIKYLKRNPVVSGEVIKLTAYCPVTYMVTADSSDTFGFRFIDGTSLKQVLFSDLYTSGTDGTNSYGEPTITDTVTAYNLSIF